MLLLSLSAVNLSAAEQNHHKTILVVGDSISAGFGIPMQQGWVALLGKELQRRGTQISVINASISGDTTQGGLTRLPGLLKTHQPDLVVLELGGNDGLRGTPIKRVKYNLSQMIQLCREANSDIVLAGMQIPPNYGRKYTQSFRETFPTLATEYKTLLIPFLLKQVVEKQGLMQADGIHPTEPAQPLILAEALPVIEQWLAQQQL